MLFAREAEARESDHNCAGYPVRQSGSLNVGSRSHVPSRSNRRKLRAGHGSVETTSHLANQTRTCRPEILQFA